MTCNACVMLGSCWRSESAGDPGRTAEGGEKVRINRGVGQLQRAPAGISWKVLRYARDLADRIENHFSRKPPGDVVRVIFQVRGIGHRRFGRQLVRRRAHDCSYEMSDFEAMGNEV